MAEIFNRQRKVRINLAAIRDFAEMLNSQVLEIENKKFNVAFVSDAKMRELNQRFRGKKQTTDVLSFPFEADEFDQMDDFLGDVIISAEQAEKQASENNLEFETEIKQLVLHGVLHLCGYDHETDDGEMNERELWLRAKIGI